MVTQITALSQRTFQAKAGDCLAGLADISITVDPFLVASLQIVDNDTNALVYSFPAHLTISSGTYSIEKGFFCPFSMPGKTFKLRAELLILGWAGWTIASKQNLAPITLLVSTPKPAGTSQVIVQRSNGMPAAGAKVVVDIPGVIGIFGNWHAEGTTDQAGTVNLPEFSQPFTISPTADVFATWTDADGQQWYAQGEWSIDWLNNWNPDPLTLQLTPGSVTPPGRSETTFFPPTIGAFFGSIPWYVWAIAAVGITTVIIVAIRPGRAAGFIVQKVRGE